MLIHHHQLKTLVEEQHNSNYNALVIAADVDVEGEGLLSIGPTLDSGKV